MWTLKVKKRTWPDLGVVRPVRPPGYRPAVALEIQCKASIFPFFRKPVVDELQMRPGHWCHSFEFSFVLSIGWYERRLAPIKLVWFMFSSSLLEWVELANPDASMKWPLSSKSFFNGHICWLYRLLLSFDITPTICRVRGFAVTCISEIW